MRGGGARGVHRGRVRPFIMTGGRTAPSGGTCGSRPCCRRTGRDLPEHLAPEQTAILRACMKPTSVAEVAAGLGLVLGVVTVLPATSSPTASSRSTRPTLVEIELDALTRMLERVRSLWERAHGRPDVFDHSPTTSPR